MGIWSWLRSLVKRTESGTQGRVVPVFVPALVVLLKHEEDRKGTALTREEVMSIRDRATVVALPASASEQMERARGYPDIDPENCWEQWQMVRTRLESPKE